MSSKQPLEASTQLRLGTTYEKNGPWTLQSHGLLNAFTVTLGSASQIHPSLTQSRSLRPCTAQRKVALPKCTFLLSPVQNKTKSHPHQLLAPSPLSSVLNNVENLWRESCPPLYPPVMVREGSATSSKEENPPIKVPAFLRVPEEARPGLWTRVVTHLFIAMYLPGSASLVNYNLSYVTQYS